MPRPPWSVTRSSIECARVLHAPAPGDMALALAACSIPSDTPGLHLQHSNYNRRNILHIDSDITESSEDFADVYNFFSETYPFPSVQLMKRSLIGTVTTSSNDDKNAFSGIDIPSNVVPMEFGVTCNNEYFNSKVIPDNSSTISLEMCVSTATNNSSEMIFEPCYSIVSVSNTSVTPSITSLVPSPMIYTNPTQTFSHKLSYNSYKCNKSVDDNDTLLYYTENDKVNSLSSGSKVPLVQSSQLQSQESVSEFAITPTSASNCELDDANARFLPENVVNTPNHALLQTKSHDTNESSFFSVPVTVVSLSNLLMDDTLLNNNSSDTIQQPTECSYLRDAINSYSRLNVKLNNVNCTEVKNDISRNVLTELERDYPGKYTHCPYNIQNECEHFIETEDLKTNSVSLSRNNSPLKTRTIEIKMFPLKRPFEISSDQVRSGQKSDQSSFQKIKSRFPVDITNDKRKSVEPLHEVTSRYSVSKSIKLLFTKRSDETLTENSLKNDSLDISCESSINDRLHAIINADTEFPGKSTNFPFDNISISPEMCHGEVSCNSLFSQSSEKFNENVCSASTSLSSNTTYTDSLEPITSNLFCKSSDIVSLYCSKPCNSDEQQHLPYFQATSPYFSHFRGGLGYYNNVRKLRKKIERRALSDLKSYIGDVAVNSDSEISPLKRRRGSKGGHILLEQLRASSDRLLDDKQLTSSPKSKVLLSKLALAKSGVALRIDLERQRSRDSQVSVQYHFPMLNSRL